MKQVVKDFKPNSEDISSILALYRPGPLDVGLIPKFINRKWNRKVDFPHPFINQFYRNLWNYGLPGTNNENCSRLSWLFSW